MLYFVPTPIGNLADISHHSLEILSICEVMICEDTRVSKSLVNLLNERYDAKISPQIYLSLHTHNEKDFFKSVDNKIFSKICVYVSDAGMPCVSDPGVSLVRYAINNNIKYEILSGSNAALIAVCASGLVQKEFIFLGFLPNTGQNRTKAIENALNLPYPSVIYESKNRLLKLIGEIAKLDEKREIFLIKEATKKFEMKFRNNALNLLKILQNTNLQGEWCVVIDKKDEISVCNITQNDINELEMPPKTRAKLLAKLNAQSAKKIYNELIK